MTRPTALFSDGDGPITFDGAVHYPGVIDHTLYSTSGIGHDGFTESEHIVPLWTYDVPAEILLEMQSLLVAVSIPGLLTLPNLFPYRSRLGTVTVAVDSGAGDVTIAEFQVNDIEHNCSGSVGNNVPAGPWSTSAKSRSFVNLGGGITLTSGQVLTVYYTPLANDPDAVYPHNLHITAFGVDASTGKHLPMGGLFHVMDLTASQVAYRYTAPAGGLKLKTLQVSPQGWSIALIRHLEVRLNSQAIFRLGNFHCLATVSTPCRFNVPMQGITLHPGERLQIYGHIWGHLGQILSVTPVGTRIPIGYTRSRSVNR